MSKKSSSGKKKTAKGPKRSFDRHFFSAVVGIALGAGAFYAKKSMDGKAASTV